MVWKKNRRCAYKFWWGSPFKRFVQTLSRFKKATAIADNVRHREPQYTTELAGNREEMAERRWPRLNDYVDRQALLPKDAALLEYSKQMISAWITSLFLVSRCNSTILARHDKGASGAWNRMLLRIKQVLHTIAGVHPEGTRCHSLSN